MSCGSLSTTTPGQTGAVCFGEHTLRLEPGVSTTRGRSTFSNEGGTVTCHGQLQGRDVTGIQGEIREGGVLVGSCEGGELAGIMTISVPTPDPRKATA